VKLSFCIPTYNHAEFLGPALDSIFSQITDDFEIVIVDGASTDTTQEVAESYRQRHRQIVYFRREQNCGVDPDIAKSIELAQGEYCWLVSSDDILPPGAIDRVLAEISSDCDVYLGGRAEGTMDMQIYLVNSWFNIKSARQWTFASDSDFADYLNSARSIACLFSYISVIIVRRASWLRGDDGTPFYGSCYAHAFRLWSSLARGLNMRLRIIDKPIVYCRMDNDKFAPLGLVRRYMLDFDGFGAIANAVFGDRPAVRSAFLRVIRREHGLLRLAKLRSACKDEAQWAAIRPRISGIGYRSLTLRAATIIGRSRFIISPLVALKRAAKRMLGDLRHKPQQSGKF
jgi:abequosyltransferase